MEFSWPLVAIFWYIIRNIQETGVDCGLNVALQGWRIWKRLRKQGTSTDYKKGNPTSYRIFQAGNSHSQKMPLSWFFFKLVQAEQQKWIISPSLSSWFKINSIQKIHINTFQEKIGISKVMRKENIFWDFSKERERRKEEKKITQYPSCPNFLHKIPKGISCHWNSGW